MTDATFEEGREAPLNLGALDQNDLEVLSSLVQDAVFEVGEMSWRPRERRFAILINRFRWEDRGAAERRKRSYERVRALLVVDNVLGVASQGIDRKEKELVLSILGLSFEGDENGSGQILVTLAGDGAIRLSIEALELTLKDVTRPYAAPSGKAPQHPE